MRKETSTCEIIFSIVKIINKTYRHDAIYSEISDELNYFKNDIDRNRKSFNELVKVTLSEKQAMTDQTDNNVQMID